MKWMCEPKTVAPSLWKSAAGWQFSEGKAIGVQGVARDITARRQAEEALREADQRALSEYERLLEKVARLAQTLGTARDLQGHFLGTERVCSSCRFPATVCLFRFTIPFATCAPPVMAGATARRSTPQSFRRCR